MEQMENLQRANQQQQLEEWVHRVEACQRSDGRPMVRGKWDRSIHLFFLAEEGVSGRERVRQAIFAKAPVLEDFYPFGHVVASVKVSGVRMQIYEGADKNTLQAVFKAVKSC